MGQRLTVVLACVTATMVSVQAADQKKLSDSVKSAIQFFERHDVRSQGCPGRPRAL